MANINLNNEYDRDVGPMVIARSFFDNFDIEEDGRISAWNIAVEWDATRFKTTNIRLKFHSNAINNNFVMKNSRGAEVNSTNFSEIRELGGDAGEVGRIIEDAIAQGVGKDWLQFEFAELDAASVGHEYLMDYEFQYDMLVNASDIEKARIDSI